MTRWPWRALAQPSLIRSRPLHVAVETEGRLTAGQSAW